MSNDNKRGQFCLKKALSILSIILLLFEIFFVPAAFNILRLDIKADSQNEVYRLMNKHKYRDIKTKLIFHESQIDNNPDLKFIHSKEFRYKGEMYDVVRRDNKGDSVYFYCYHDRMETRLMAALEQFIIESTGIRPGSAEKGFRQTEIKSQVDRYFSNVIDKQPEYFEILTFRSKVCITLNNYFDVLIPPPKPV